MKMKENERVEIQAMYASLSEKITLKERKDWLLELKIIQNDPKSLLCSQETFENFNLKPDVLKGLKRAHLDKPTKFQETVIPHLIAESPRDMIAQSQSSTGKTAAIIIGMLDRVDTKVKETQVLFFVPTYELAVHIGQIVQGIAGFRGDIGWVFDDGAGVMGNEQVIIGAPEHIYMSWKKGKFDATSLKVFAVDEADYMLTTPDCWDKCSEIQKQLPPTCQMILFSTTYDHSSMEIARSIVKSPIEITLSPEQLPLDNITQIYVRCDSQGDKYQAIRDIYELLRSMNIGAIKRPIADAFIFCNTNETAQELYENMKDFCPVELITNEVCKTPLLFVDQGNRRCQTLNFALRCGKMVIATDILSRGIHYPFMAIVVNFDLPVNQSGEPDYNIYLNRIGRTGRFGKKGIAINLIDTENSMELCKTIERHFKKEIKPIDSFNARIFNQPNPNDLPHSSYEDANMKTTFMCHIV